MLENAHSRPFWGVFLGGERVDPKCSQILSRSLKGTFLAGNTRFGV